MMQQTGSALKKVMKVFVCVCGGMWYACVMVVCGVPAYYNCVHLCAWCPWRPEEGIIFLRTGVSNALNC